MRHCCKDTFWCSCATTSPFWLRTCSHPPANHDLITFHQVKTLLNQLCRMRISMHLNHRFWGSLFAGLTWYSLPQATDFLAAWDPSEAHLWAQLLAAHGYQARAHQIPSESESESFIMAIYFEYPLDPPLLIPSMFCRAFCILSRLQNALQNINCWNSSVSEVILSKKNATEGPYIMPPADNTNSSVQHGNPPKIWSGKIKIPKWFRFPDLWQLETGLPGSNNGP